MHYDNGTIYEGFVDVATGLQDAMLHSATGHSIAAIDAAFERGKLRIQERLDEEIRRSQAAAARLNRRLEELCALTKSAEDDHIKSKIGAALSQKDVRALCELMQADAAAPAFDVNIQAGDLIVSQSLRQLLYSALSFSCIIHSNTLHTQVRRFRKIRYDNGTAYEGFVDETTGLPDGDGTVTWGASAGRSRGKSYTGRFAAGLTADRIKFTWKEHRAGQACAGHHAYCGTVEVGRCFVFLARACDKARAG